MAIQKLPNNVRPFNIYYLNLSKTYEISMMIDNAVTTSLEREHLSSKERNSDLGIKAGGTFAPGSNISSSMSINSKKLNSEKLREIIEVKSTKSHLLAQVISMCKEVELNNNDVCEGDLVKLNGVKLILHNEEELRQIKLMNNGIFNGVSVEQFQVSNLIASVLQDYSYLLIGNTGSDRIMLKIPMKVESEFENLYNIDDVLIGEVTIIGIYKGTVAVESIKNTFSYLTKQTQFVDSDVVVSDISEADVGIPTEHQYFHFIDLISIVQEITFRKDESEQRNTGNGWRRLLRRSR